jgi:hypothetical protein
MQLHAVSCGFMQFHTASYGSTTSLLADVHSGLMKIPAFHPEITQQWL